MNCIKLTQGTVQWRTGVSAIVDLRFLLNVETYLCNRIAKRLRWSRGSVLAFSTQVRGFKPGRSRRIFKGEKILSTPSFGGEVKPSVSCRRFTACKRTLECIVEVGISRQNYQSSFSPTSRYLELSRHVRRGETSGGKSGNS